MTEAVNPPPEVPQTECRICRVDVPAGDFCGLCGCHLMPRRHEGPDWLRLRNFSAAPGEHLLRPSLTSSLFPHLAHRGAFRLALAAFLAALVACAVFRLPAALVALAVLGLPMLFVLYLLESDALQDLPTRLLTVSALLGIALGVGWALLTGAAVARSSGGALGEGATSAQLLSTHVAIPLGGAVLMLVPGVVTRVLDSARSREALDGFSVGALGALLFTAAATLTRLLPQLRTGMVSDNPVATFLVEAGIRGVALPVISVAGGGLIGAALWFSRSVTHRDQHPRVVRALLVAFAAIVLFVPVALAMVDATRSSQWLTLALYLAIAAVALFALRLGLHLALLHEGPDEIAADQPVLCTRCAHVVPDMPFCAHCGVAMRASSRSSRAVRRTSRPERMEPGQQ